MARLLRVSVPAALLLALTFLAIFSAVSRPTCVAAAAPAAAAPLSSSSSSSSSTTGVTFGSASARRGAAAATAGVVAGATTLRLDGAGQLRIVQLADLHYSFATTCADDVATPSPGAACSDANTTALIGRVLDAEQPVGLAVFTGDNSDRPVPGTAAAINAWAAPVMERGVPWAVILGNHDADNRYPEDGDLSRREIMEAVQAMPFAVAQAGPEEVFGASNYLVQILNATNDANVFNLWFFDSAPFATAEGVGEFDWVRPSQLQWYEETAAVVREANGGEIVPALAFFHIPIREYNLTSDRVGDLNRPPNPAAMNSGLFASFKVVGDVRATFVGHDHTNDACGEYYGISLCYGGGIGYGEKAWGLAGWARRSRVIQIEAFGAGVRTWKRVDDGNLSIKDEQVLVPYEVERAAQKR